MHGRCRQCVVVVWTHVDGGLLSLAPAGEKERGEEEAPDTLQSVAVVNADVAAAAASGLSASGWIRTNLTLTHPVSLMKWSRQCMCSVCLYCTVVLHSPRLLTAPAHTHPRALSTCALYWLTASRSPPPIAAVVVCVAREGMIYGGEKWDHNQPGAWREGERSRNSSGERVGISKMLTAGRKKTSEEEARSCRKGRRRGHLSFRPQLRTRVGNAGRGPYPLLENASERALGK